MGVTETKGITPEESGEPIGGEKKRYCSATGSGGQLPVRVSYGIAPPLAEVIEAREIRPVHGVRCYARSDNSRCEDQ